MLDWTSDVLKMSAPRSSAQVEFNKGTTQFVEPPASYCPLSFDQHSEQSAVITDSDLSYATPGSQLEEWPTRGVPKSDCAVCRPRHEPPARTIRD